MELDYSNIERLAPEEIRRRREEFDRHFIEPPIKFREGSSMLIPYMEMPLADSGQKLPIEDIIVGPTPTMNLSMESLVRYLRRSGVDSRIASCGIPYRGSSTR